MIIIQLDAAKLDNPDLDIRYVLPDLLVFRAGGLLLDGGHGYAEDGPGSAMLLFLETDEPDAAVPIVIGGIATIQHTRAHNKRH